MTIDIDIPQLLGAPTIAGPLALWPIFGPAPRLGYRSLSQATAHGAFVAELAEGASVNDVRVCNASDRALLLYEGELILGARQNRTIDQPVLVPAGAELTVPVSCVEEGRWDADHHHDHFAPAPHAVHPAMRRTKRASSNARAAAGGPPRPDQREVWASVDDELDAHAVASPGNAFTDVFAAQRAELDELTGSIAAEEGQTGVLVAFAGRAIALDLVSRADVFADLLPRLAAGYALQALREQRSGTPGGEPPAAGAEAFLERVLGTDRRWQPTPGRGEAFTPIGCGVEGCGLRVDDELVALSAFPVGG